MEWTIPGTVLTVPQEKVSQIPAIFSAMFLAGDVTLGQIVNITGLEPYAIQNWVKRGFLSPPQNKRYTQDQLCRILNIHMLKAALSLEQICGLLGYINGDLEDEGDDLISDSKLYFLFVQLAYTCPRIESLRQREDYIDRLIEDYQTAVPGARERVKTVLEIMLTAWSAAALRQRAESMITNLK